MICHQTNGPRFDWLLTYLLSSERNRERVQWTEVRNLPTRDPHLVALLMEATASQNPRVVRAPHHFSVLFAPSDRVDRGLVERVADRLLRGLGLSEHQALMVAHRGEHNPHLHILINRVHPETGRAWSTWHSFRRGREVLCELEQSFGLEALSSQAQDVSAVARDVRSYERVLVLADEQYRADLEARHAHARWMRLELMAEQGRSARARSDHALAKVFQDPARCHDSFVAAANHDGVAVAARCLRERPEQFGALVAVERTRALGFKHVRDDGEARAAAAAAAVAAEEALVALREWQAAAQSTARELDGIFERELGACYLEPQAARRTFEGLAAEHGSGHAGAVVIERPAQLGAVRARAVEPGDQFSVLLARAIGWGQEAHEARIAARATAPPARGAGRPSRLAEGPGERDRADAVRAEASGLPSRRELEERLGVALSRFSGREWRLLRAALTRPQSELARRLYRTLRDAALGREEREA